VIGTPFADPQMVMAAVMDGVMADGDGVMADVVMADGR
jgi:hypothetical protein